MTKIYKAPLDHEGHLVVPEGFTSAWVHDCPQITAITFPEGCASAWVYNCQRVTVISFPEGCADAWVDDCPKYIDGG